jgi:phage terminase small subunit
MPKHEKPSVKPPGGLEASGRALWRAVTAEVPGDWQLDARDLAILEAACRQADDVAALEAAVSRDGVMVEGAAGQRRLNGAVSELRQARLALGRLLGQVDLPDERGRPVTESSRRAQRAANVRWAAQASRSLMSHG